MPHPAATIGDFSILPISVPPVPAFPQTVVHHIYLRRNAPQIPTANDSRSLFASNLPVDTTPLHLRGLVTALIGAGRFETVEFEGESASARQRPDDLEPAQAARLAAHNGKKRKHQGEAAERARDEELATQLPMTWARPLRRSGGTAVLVLADDKSVDQVLKTVARLHKSRQYPVWGDHIGARVPPLGAAWLRAHNRLTYPEPAAVQDAIDAFFTVFNRKEREAAELAKRLRNEPDEDGFVTVTRGAGRTAPARQDEAEEARRKMVAREDKKKQELANFYRFQLRERKKAEQADLVKRFEEDRKKIAAMREKRASFRPET